MSEYNEKWCYVTLSWKICLGTWLEMTSAFEHSQCLPNNFNIFNDKKNTVSHDNYSST